VDEAEGVSSLDEVGVSLVSSDGSISRFTGTSSGSNGSFGGTLGMSGGSLPGGSGSGSGLTSFARSGLGLFVGLRGLLPSSSLGGDTGCVLGLGFSGMHSGGGNSAGMFL